MKITGLFGKYRVDFPTIIKGQQAIRQSRTKDVAVEELKLKV